MARLFFFMAMAALMLSGVANADLKPGYITTRAWRLLAVDVSTQQDVLELLGAPKDKLDIKTKKFFRYLWPQQIDAMKACMPADSDRIALWKYHNVNRENDGKFSFMSGHGEYEFTYIAFHADGRVCNVLAHESDY